MDVQIGDAVQLKSDPRMLRFIVTEVHMEGETPKATVARVNAGTNDMESHTVALPLLETYVATSTPRIRSIPVVLR